MLLDCQVRLVGRTVSGSESWELIPTSVMQFLALGGDAVPLFHEERVLEETDTWSVGAPAETSLWLMVSDQPVLVTYTATGAAAFTTKLFLNLHPGGEAVAGSLLIENEGATTARVRVLCLGVEVA